MCTTRAVSLRHAASRTAVRPALLMGARGGSSVDIVVVAPGSSSAGRVLGNHSSLTNVGGAVKPKKQRARTCTYMCMVSYVRYTNCCAFRIFCWLCFCRDGCYVAAAAASDAAVAAGACFWCGYLCCCCCCHCCCASSAAAAPAAQCCFFLPTLLRNTPEYVYEKKCSWHPTSIRT